MKKFTSVLALGLLASTVAFAEPAMIMGKIKAIELGAKPQVTIVDAQGKESKLMLSHNTSISDKSGNKLTANKLAAGEQVNVKAEGNAASTIQVEA